MAELLPASTFPTQIVLADRYVDGGGDPSLIEQEPWDVSVQAIAHYPTVLKWMDDNLTWTTAVGNAFLNQQTDVMTSIQRLRATAQGLGNLSATPQEQVVDNAGEIEILPVDPEVIYVPVYDPTVVYFQVPESVPFIVFGVGYAYGTWNHHDFDWGHHHLVVWNGQHPRPANWWSLSAGQRAGLAANQATAWHPSASRNVGSATRFGSARNYSGLHPSVPAATRLYTEPSIPSNYKMGGKPSSEMDLPAKNYVYSVPPPAESLGGNNTLPDNLGHGPNVTVVPSQSSMSRFSPVGSTAIPMHAPAVQYIAPAAPETRLESAGSPYVPTTPPAYSQAPAYPQASYSRGEVSSTALPHYEVPVREPHQAPALTSSSSSSSQASTANSSTHH